MVVEGEQVVVGDTAAASTGLVEYEVLCRRHYMRRMNSHAARAASPSPDVLPFDLDVCPVPPRPEPVCRSASLRRRVTPPVSASARGADVAAQYSGRRRSIRAARRGAGTSRSRQAQPAATASDCAALASARAPRASGCGAAVRCVLPPPRRTEHDVVPARHARSTGRATARSSALSRLRAVDGFGSWAPPREVVLDLGPPCRPCRRSAPRRSWRSWLAADGRCRQGRPLGPAADDVARRRSRSSRWADTGCCPRAAGAGAPAASVTRSSMGSASARGRSSPGVPEGEGRRRRAVGWSARASRPSGRSARADVARWCTSSSTPPSASMS